MPTLDEQIAALQAQKAAEQAAADEAAGESGSQAAVIRDIAAHVFGHSDQGREMFARIEAAFNPQPAEDADQAEDAAETPTPTAAVPAGSALAQ